MKAHYGMLKSARNAGTRKKVADSLRKMREFDRTHKYTTLTRKDLNAANRQTAQRVANIWRGS